MLVDGFDDPTNASVRLDWAFGFPTLALDRWQAGDQLPFVLLGVALLFEELCVRRALSGHRDIIAFRASKIGE